MEQDTAGTDMSVGSLASIVGSGGPLAFVEVLALGVDAAGNLADRHAAGQAHGGVQPRVIVRDGEGTWVLANPLAIGANEAATAPELRDDPEPTPAADVYALGATLVFALTGQAFQHGSLGASTDGEDALAADADAAPDADATAAVAAVDATPLGVTPVGVALTLPEVMDLFLNTLRRTLASDPAVRGPAAGLAATLGQLRDDAERVLAGTVAAPPSRSRTSAAAVGTATAAGAVILSPIAAMAEYPAGEATGVVAPAATPKTLKERLPLMVAVGAVALCLVLAVALLRKNDKPSEVLSTGTSSTTSTLAVTTTAPIVVVPGTDTTTTTIASTTTTKLVSTTTTATTIPPTTVAPTTTIPSGTALVTVDMSHMTNCPGCLASLRSKPQLAASVTAQFPDRTELFGKCITDGESAHDDQGFTSSQWLFVIGPIAQGWTPIHLVGRTTYGLPQCPQEQPTTTTAAPTTTTSAPTTTTTAAPATTTTATTAPAATTTIKTTP